MKRAVINFAKGGWYPRGQQRLKNSLVQTGFTGDFIGYTSYKAIYSPSHQEVPYAFKTFAIMDALRRGYEQVIYVDSSIYAVKSWKPIWDIMDTQGYFIEEAGQWVGTWTKDSVLKKFGVTRDEAMTIPMFTAGFTGLNFKKSIGENFLMPWHKYACDGDSFKGTWGNENGQMSKDLRCKGHRHDMSVASLLAHRLNMKMSKGGTYLSYIGKGYAPPKPTVCCHLQPCR